MNKIEDDILKIWNNQIAQQELNDLINRFQQNENEWRILSHAEFEENIQITSSLTSSQLGLYNTIEQKIIENKTVVQTKSESVLKLSFIKWIAAASVFILSFSIWMYMKPQAKENIEIVATTVSGKNEKGYWIHNQSDSLQLITTIDNSVISLYPSGSIYVEMHYNDKRQIALNGKATFNVANDKSKPFTVISNDISVTALGTVFTVDNGYKNYLKVDLEEGRVVVNSTNNTKKFAAQYLTPGESISINMLANSYEFIRNESEGNKNVRVKQSAPLKVENRYSTLAFNQQPLTEVFKSLESHFGIQFMYDESSELNQIEFTGKFLRKDSLDNILNIISTLNPVSFSYKNKTTIVVSKTE